jgi:K+-transporting ATPase KdpF subunit
MFTVVSDSARKESYDEGLLLLLVIAVLAIYLVYALLQSEKF